MSGLFAEIAEQLGTPPDNPFGSGYGSTGMWQTLLRNTLPTPPWPGPDSGFATEADWLNWYGPEIVPCLDAQGRELYEDDLLEHDLYGAAFPAHLLRIWPEANAFLVRWADGTEEWQFSYEGPNFLVRERAAH